LWIRFWLFTMSHNPLIMWSCWTRMVAGRSSKPATLHENQRCIICSIENVSNFIFAQNNVLPLKIDITGMRIWSWNPTIRGEEAKMRRCEQAKRRTGEDAKRRRSDEILHIFEILNRLSIKLYNLFNLFNLDNLCALIYLAYLWV
jgi:hypothetical protein